MQDEDDSIRHETVILDSSQIPAPPNDTKGNIILAIVALAGLIGIIGFYFM